MNPNTKFKRWLRIAKNKYEFDATAFALSTCENNIPSVRMVLLKKLLPDGLVFFTNLNSKKGQHFKKNKNLSMCFYWESLQKQVRISGEGVLIKDEESDEYFSSRSRGSQIGAWASKQSNEIEKRDTLIKKFNYLTKKYENKPVPRPSYWVGIKVKPNDFEFWQGGKYRLHKREFFYLKNKKWHKKLLSP